MANVLVRGVNQSAVRAWKARARRNRRSLQAELRELIEGMAAPNAASIARAAARSRRLFRGALASHGVSILREIRDQRSDR